MAKRTSKKRVTRKQPGGGMGRSSPASNRGLGKKQGATGGATRSQAGAGARSGTRKPTMARSKQTLTAAQRRRNQAT